MKFLWFHLMPYTELPDDFAQKHPSVWVDIDPTLFDATRAGRMYNDFMDELEFASEQGFDAICVNEHHNNGYGLMPSPNLIATALARRTKSTALCVMGNSLALYNPPLRVAEEMAMIDCISGGRLIAGFPVGSPMDTAYAYGANPSQLRQRYQEAHDLILEAWTRREVFAFNGRFYQQRYVNPWPRPLQQPRPPIWIPGGGSVDTWRWCAAMDYVYCYLSYFGYKVGRRTMHGFWQAMTDLGHDPNPYQAGFIQFVGVAETEAEAQALYREPAEYFYQRCLHVDPRFADPPGYVTEATLRSKSTSMIQQAAARAKSSTDRSTADREPGDQKPGDGKPRDYMGTTRLKRDWEEILAKGYVIVGTPDQVAEKLREVALDLNVGHLMLLLQFGNMKKDLALYNTRLFAEQVAPQLRDLFAGQWEDRWWPQHAAPVATERAPRRVTSASA